MSHPHPGAAGRRAGSAARTGGGVPASEFGAALRRPAGLDWYDPDDHVDPYDLTDPAAPARPGGPFTG